MLDVTDCYLPDLAGSSRAAVLSNLPIKFVAQWTYLQRYRRSRRLETDVKGFDERTGSNAATFDAWAARTNCDTIVFVDLPPGSRLHTALPGGDLDAYVGLLQSQRLFTMTRRQTLPQYGCTVTVWRRAAAPPLR